MVALLFLALARWIGGQLAEVLPEIPPLVELLGRAAPVVARFLGGVLTYLEQESLADDVASLQSQLDEVTAVLMAYMHQTAYVDDNEARAVHNSAREFDAVGGAIAALGVDQWNMWERLRYNLMPNTIQYVWNFVLDAWIRPLRKGLIVLYRWTFGWVIWLEGFVIDVEAYAKQIQVWGRTWRMRYVYPQLMFLLSPWRVAYWYAQAFSTAIVQYLSYEGHKHDRDGLARVTYQQLSPLWQAFDSGLARWLRTDVSAYGWGSSLPTFPPGADRTPPKPPPTVWEPFVSEPHEPKEPPYIPNIPDADWHY